MYVFRSITMASVLTDTTFLQQTPIAPFQGTVIKPRVGLTPILRAGLGMTDALVSDSSYRFNDDNESSRS